MVLNYTRFFCIFTGVPGAGAGIGCKGNIGSSPANSNIMPTPLIIAHNAQSDIALLPAMSNRHGLITGATGTGKTVSLQVMAERFSSIGVPVFMADVKGDLAGMSQPGVDSPKLHERLARIGVEVPAFAGFPVEFWDVYG